MGKLFNHVQIKVKSWNISRKFYDIIMAALGYDIVLEIENTVIGYGSSVHDMLEIRQFDDNYRLSQFVHIALNAPSVDKVDTFYNLALENGGKCNGRPGYRPQYEEGYYSAFIIDPDGHNIEAVHSLKYHSSTN